MCVGLLRLSVLAIVVYSLVAPAECNASNKLFLPGDAFFPTSLTKDAITKIRKMRSDVRTFAFGATDQMGGALCGYAGYPIAKIPQVDDSFLDNLGLVYSKMQRLSRGIQRDRSQKATDHDRETEGMRVLFYPASFDFQMHRIGLTYNENWVEETKKFGHDRSHISYGSLIDRADAVAISWRDALEVKGLEVTTPDVELKPTPLLETPIVVKERVRAHVLGVGSLKDFFDPDEDTPLTLYIVDSNEIEEWQYQHGKWERVAFRKDD